MSDSHSGDHNLSMLCVIAKTDGNRDRKKAKVVGFTVYLSTEENEQILFRSTQNDLLTLDEWHTVSVFYNFTSKRKPACALFLDGKVQSAAAPFYRHADGRVHYNPTGEVYFKVGTLMRTCGTVYFDGMDYSEEKPNPSRTPMNEDAPEPKTKRGDEK